MTLATYNVHHCEGSDGVLDIDRVARTIKKMEPDLIALQELDQGWERSERVDQPAELERLTGLKLEFWPTFEKGETRYGFALAARDGFTSRFVQLPTPPGEEPRGAAIADLGSIQVIVTHLSRHRGSRRAQKRALAGLALKLREARPELPVFVMGDLNHRPLPWGHLRRAGLTGGHPTPTYPSDRPRRHIDHLLTFAPTEVRAQSAPRSQASDHLPLVAEVVLPG